MEVTVEGEAEEETVDWEHWKWNGEEICVEQGACRETRDVRRRRDEGDAGTREREHAGEG